MERYYKKLNKEEAARDLTAEMVFKLLAGFIPETVTDFNEAFRRVATSLQEFNLPPEDVERLKTRMEAVMKAMLGLESEYPSA